VVDKASLVTKVKFQDLSIPDENKLTAADVNELKRVTDDLVDALVEGGVEAVKSGGVFACDGTGPAQSVTVGGKTTVNQFVSVQDGDNFGTEAGDSSLTIPEAGIYLVLFHVNYATPAKTGDIFKWRVIKNGTAVNGICSRIPHERSGDSSYETSAQLQIQCAEGDVLAVECEGFSISTTRTFTILHGSLTAWRRFNNV
jgi:hypothetical protein